MKLKFKFQKKFWAKSDCFYSGNCLIFIETYIYKVNIINKGIFSRFTFSKITSKKIVNIRNTTFNYLENPLTY